MFAQSKGGSYSLTNGTSGVADAVDFDGATDYLSRSSDLVGNADGKTFTFSAWVYSASNSSSTEQYLYSNENGRFIVGYTPSTNTLVISGASAAGSLVFHATIANAFSLRTMNHVLLSIDLSGVGSSYVYINDVNVTPAFNTFTNTAIDFTRVWHKVAQYGGGDNFLGRLAHLFLAYEYVDLSVEANRRVFITADRKPA